MCPAAAKFDMSTQSTESIDMSTKSENVAISHRYAIVPATLDHVLAMAPQLRQADIDELTAAGNDDPVKALVQSFRMSTMSWAGLVIEDGVEHVACIFGVAPLNLLGGKGVPWLLGTDLIERHGMAFLRRNRKFIPIMMTLYNHLENHVDARNTVAIAWLKWLGFAFDDPVPYGPRQVPFLRFQLRSPDV